MGAQGGEEPRADARHPVQAGRAAEWAVGLAIRHDLLGERETDPGEPGQLGGGRPVGIDPLPRPQRAAQGEDAVAVGGRRLGRQGGEELDLAGGFTGPGEPPADTLAHEPQREQQQQRAALGGGHAGR